MAVNRLAHMDMRSILLSDSWFSAQNVQSDHTPHIGWEISTSLSSQQRLISKHYTILIL